VMVVAFVSFINLVTLRIIHASHALEPVRFMLFGRINNDAWMKRARGVQHVKYLFGTRLSRPAIDLSMICRDSIWPPDRLHASCKPQYIFLRIAGSRPGWETPRIA
jgi:hypothetical protein